MAPLLEDPRIRQTWNNISQNAETATETAAAGIWSFVHDYINPCFASMGESIEQCTTQCFPDREERARRLRERDRARGRAEYSFDFYDDWDDEEAGASGGLLGWGNDELDRLLAGSGSHSHGPEDQPSGRKRKMSYGTRRPPKRRGTVDGLPDPTIIPSTSALGFLQRLPFKFGGTLRYKPSAADLQDHPGAHRAELGDDAEAEPLIDEDHSDYSDAGELHITKTRPRSSTTASGDTSDSFRSRGDLFPSDGEDDAVPLSDEFATTLGRRGTVTTLEDHSSSKTRNSSKGKSRARSLAMSRTLSGTSHSSSQSLTGPGSKFDESAAQPSDRPNEEDINIPPLSELEQEEERLRQQEEAELQSKREAAIKLASERGLSIGELHSTRAVAVAPTRESVRTPDLEDDHPPQTANAEKTDTKPSSEPTITNGLTNGLPSEAKLVFEETADQDFVPARLPRF
ncbi:hypothetical protein V491_09361 [Pseudogymnoascus sp. VKM F-3775]|nr:hypothetical protein V491_09361 [Pseudogymnoascus sp. VKM F-3775]